MTLAKREKPQRICLQILADNVARRVAQWESAILTWWMSTVQSRPRLPKYKAKAKTTPVRGRLFSLYFYTARA
jgi:hypothetical protein